MNKTEEAIEIEFKSATVFSDDATRGVEGINFETIKAPDRPADWPKVQKQIWDANLVSRLNSTVRAATQAESFGKLKEEHREDILLAAKSLDQGLIGLSKTSGDSLFLLRTRSEIAGLELYRARDGKSEVIAKGLEAALRMVAQFRHPSEFQGTKEALDEVLGFYKDGADTLVLTRTDELELWRVGADKVERVERGPDALYKTVAHFRTPTEFERFGRAPIGVLTFFKDGLDTLLLTRASGQLADIELKRMSGSQIETVARGLDAIVQAVAHFRTPSEFEPVDGVPFELLTFCRVGADTLVLMRTAPFGPIELRQVTADTVKVVERGTKAITYLDEVHKRIAEAKSDDKAVFLHIPSAASAGGGRGGPPPGRPPIGLSGWSDPDGFSFRFGKTEIKVGRDQLAKLLAEEDINPELDQRLREAIGKRPVVLMQDAFSRGVSLTPFFPGRVRMYDPGRVHLDPVRLALELQRRYPDAQIYLDDPEDLDKVRERVATIYRIGGPRDVAVIYDPSKEFQDFGIFDRIQPFIAQFALQTYPIPFAEAYLPRNVPEPNLIVLSGHKDDRFRIYVDRLARSGVFKDKVVALFSCYERTEEGFNSRLIAREAGAKAVLYFTTRIDAAAVTRVLQELSERLDEVARDNPAVKPDLKKLLDDSFDKELKKPRLNEQEKQELQKMRKALLLQVTDARPVAPAKRVFAG